MTAFSASATVTVTVTLQLPPDWTHRQAADVLFAATTEGADLTVALRQLTDPRTLIPHQVRAAAGTTGPVATSYLELPAGRAILAQTPGAAQLWLPLAGADRALVLGIVTDQPAWTAAAATVLTEIGRRLTIARDTSVQLRGAHSGRPSLAAR